MPRCATASLAVLTMTATLATPLAAHADSSSKPTGTKSTTSATTSLTAREASAEARKSGKPVPVPGAITNTSTLTAEPNGSMSLTETPIPVRKKVDGAWEPLDATLVKNADGQISPKVSTDSLRLSAGGTGSLATMAAGTESVSITLPARLPVPSLSGPSATYANVAPGIDLVVTANTQGGFSDVFVVHNAAAATSTALKNLLNETVTSTGVSLAENHGAITATGRSGKAVFASNSPILWDSSTVAQAAHASASTSRGQANSSATAPGTKAHIGALTPTLNGKTLSLRPDQTILHGAKTVYPVYVDPYWNPTEDGWATVAAEYPDRGYFNNTPESAGYMAVGYGESDYSLWARSMANFSVPTATLTGSTITSAVFSATNEYSGACPDGATDEQMNIDAPSQTLNSSNAKWEYWDTASDIGSQIGYKSFAYGYSTSCSSGGSPSSVSISLLTGTFTSDVSSGKSTQTLAFVAYNESSEYGWKDFIATTAKLTLTYDFPAQITSETANSKGCGSAANPSLLGLGDVDLVAGVYQKAGSSLTANFRLYNAAKTTEYSPTSTTGATTSTASGVATTTGAKAPLTVKSTFFTGLGITTQTTFAWTVQATDGTTAGTSSTITCYFTYDPTTPGQPNLLDGGDVNKCILTEATYGYQIGSSATFYITPNTGSTPASYLYQLNGAAPLSVNASNGKASFSLKPTQGSNILTVTAVNASGNIGDDPARCDFAAKAAATADDGDLTGDGTPDVVTTGTGSSMPAGLWLANGTATGTVDTTATDIGVNGTGLVGTAADYAGGQAITGQFTDNGFNDVLVYYPAGTTLNGETSALTTSQGEIITGTGDGSDLQAQDAENVYTVYGAALTDPNGLYPSQIANAYHADSNDTAAYPDLIGIAGSSSTGYYLDYYPSYTGIGSYSDETGGSNGLTITMNTPDGTADWNEWTIATTLAGSQVDMYLWNETTGALYLWTGIAVADGNSSSYTGTLTHTGSYPIYDGSTGHTFDKGIALHSLEAGDINSDGVPDLWTIDNSGNVTAYLMTGLSTTANATTVTPDTTQQLNTADHSWALNDYKNGSAADNTSGTALAITGTGSPYTNIGDQFTPDVAFAGTSGELSTASNALTLTGSFTVSFWTKPEAYGGAVFSQGSTKYPGITIYPTQSGWDFYLAKDDGTASWDGDSITGGSAQLGSWAHIEATYNATTKVMNLYVDDTFVATGSHTKPTTGNTGKTYLGANIAAGALTSWYKGQTAEVETWTGSALTPNEHSPASYHQSITPERILDTRSTTGDTLTESTTKADTPIASDSTTVLQIVGDTVTPTVSGAPTTIPNTATAVAVDITVVSETSSGNIITYADGTQRPITSTTNYSASTNTTGYQVVPIGKDGAIAFYNDSPGTTHLLVDITGYYTTDSTLTGDQTYHPLATAYRFFDTRTSSEITNTSLTSAGTVAAGATFTATIAGVDGIPSSGTDKATAVAINLTAVGQSGPGAIEAYQAGLSTEPTDTTLTYLGTATASLNADIPLGTATGSVGKIAINNIGSNSTDVIGDVAGYYTTNEDGQVYHAVNPTRLVDTRSGIGGYTGAVAAGGTYTLSSNSTALITTATTTSPTLALQLTTTDESTNGDLIAYPLAGTQPLTSNLNWIANQGIANLALTPTSSSGAITIYNQSSGTIDLIVDCSGYFATS